MPNPEEYHFQLPPWQGAPLPEPPSSWFPGIKEHIDACTSSRTAESDGKIRAFVIHATAGSSSSGAMSVMFKHQASWHWLIPDENEAEHERRVWICSPESRAAWHVRNSRFHPDVNNGSRFVNYWSLGVEIVNAQKNDPFSDWQVRQAAALVRYAWSNYAHLKDVVSHAKLDPDRREDPGSDFPWERFKKLVLEGDASVFDGTKFAHNLEPIPLLEIVGPDGNQIACDARPLDGVTFGEIRPLVEALGFNVEYDNESIRRMRIRKRPTRPRSKKK